MLRRQLGHPRKSGTWRTCRSPAARRAQLVEENRKPQVLKPGTWGTLYDGVGSVKRHLECASRGARFFFLPERIATRSTRSKEPTPSSNQAPGGTQIRLTVIVKPIRPRRLRLDWMIVLFSKGSSLCTREQRSRRSNLAQFDPIVLRSQRRQFEHLYPKAMILRTFDVIATLA